jgi:integrase
VWEGRVAAGQRSENSLREYRRYGAADGHFSFWHGKDVHGINFGQLEDYIVWLAARGLKPKSIANVVNAFKAMLKWMAARGDLQMVPTFPKVTVAEYAPRIISVEDLERVLEQIPWPKRGVFLVCAWEGVRISEARAFGLEDWDGKELNIAKAQGRQVDAPVRVNKTGSAVRREPAVPVLREWLTWRASQATPAARLRGEALFPNPNAENPTKRWSVSALVREWGRACKAAGVAYAPIGRATRHSTFTALARSGLSERLLRAHSRHRDARSLDRYAKLAAAPQGAIVRALHRPRPSRDPADETP